MSTNLITPISTSPISNIFSVGNQPVMISSQGLLAGETIVLQLATPKPDASGGIVGGNCGTFVDAITEDDYTYQDYLINGCQPTISSSNTSLIIQTEGMYRVVLSPSSALGHVTVSYDDVEDGSFEQWQTLGGCPSPDCCPPPANQDVTIVNPLPLPVSLQLPTIVRNLCDGTPVPSEALPVVHQGVIQAQFCEPQSVNIISLPDVNLNLPTLNFTGCNGISGSAPAINTVQLGTSSVELCLPFPVASKDCTGAITQEEALPVVQQGVADVKICIPNDTNIVDCSGATTQTTALPVSVQGVVTVKECPIQRSTKTAISILIVAGQTFTLPNYYSATIVCVDGEAFIETDINSLTARVGTTYTYSAPQQDNSDIVLGFLRVTALSGTTITVHGIV